MHLALITDTHFGARSESMLFNEYFFHFWENVFFPYLDKHGIKHIIHLGDFGERQKYMTFQIADQVQNRFLKPIAERGIQMIVLVGNHDTPSRTDNTVNCLNILNKYSNVRVVTGPVDVRYDGVPICLLPWIHKNNSEETYRHITEKTKAKVAMGHLELNGFEMDAGNVSRVGHDRELFKMFNMVLSGHYHHRSSDGHIFYLGNTYEITWADYNDPRGFHVFDTESNDLTFIPNPNRMFHKLYYRDELPQHPLDIANCYVRVVVETKQKPEMFDEYIRQVNEYGPANLQIEDLTLVDTNIPQIEVSGDTAVLMDNYIDTMVLPNVGQREHMKIFMRDLYKEAQSK